MQYEEFVDRVRRRAELDSFDEAEGAIRATLTSLGDYLAGGAGRDLASQLPQGLTEHLLRKPSGRADSFSLDDFLQEVGEREGVNADVAKVHAKAVMSVPEEAVSESEVEDVRRQFPSEFDSLFE